MLKYFYEYTGKDMMALRAKITDMSLCVNDCTPYATDEVAGEFASALLNCGVSFVEVNRQFARLLEKRDTSRQFIFHLNDKADLKAAQEKAYAFISVGSHISSVLDKLNCPAILDTDCSDPLLKDVERLKRLSADTSLSVIRITDDFSAPGRREKLKRAIRNIRSNTPLSVDCRPLDNTLGGLDWAVEAYHGLADMVTLCFGAGNRISDVLETGYALTSLERFLISIITLYHELPSITCLQSLCVASLDLSYMTNSIEAGMKNIGEIIESMSGSVPKIDSEDAGEPDNEDHIGRLAFNYVEGEAAEKEAWCLINKMMEQCGFNLANREKLMSEKRWKN